MRRQNVDIGVNENYQQGCIGKDVLLKPINVESFLFLEGNVHGLFQIGSFMGKLFVALQCSTIQYFVQSSWGRKLMVKSPLNPSQDETPPFR